MFTLMTISRGLFKDYQQYLLIAECSCVKKKCFKPKQTL